jgi:hypothetical protein
MNFTDLQGETHRDLTIPNIEYSAAGIYRVRMENALETANAFARLSVRPSPRLEITEVMSQACSPRGFDWWELTNTNAEPVNLSKKIGKYYVPSATTSSIINSIYSHGLRKCTAKTLEQPSCPGLSEMFTYAQFGFTHSPFNRNSRRS